jgi:2-polyprenyl-3-methyl-5-hydroxy-6-metoxy-1,4-benzoquinol methylase
MVLEADFIATASVMNCTTCGSSAIGEYLRSHVGTILRCATCEDVFLPPEQQLEAESLYSPDYFTEREGYFFHDGVVDRSGRESAHIADFRAGLALIEAHARTEARALARPSLLDVGCATGSFLSLAQAKGWECRGVEVSAFAAAQAREQTGCEIFCGKLEDAPFDSGAFDVITMWDLLEHLPDPLQGLEKARRLLKPSGLLLVNTPNENSLLRQVARLMYRGSGGLITAPVNHLYHRYHLHYFAAETLTVLFRRAGFELVEMSIKPIPTTRGRISLATKMAMKVLSVAARLLDAEYELIVLARNPGPAPNSAVDAGGDARLTDPGSQPATGG